MARPDSKTANYNMGKCLKNRNFAVFLKKGARGWGLGD